MKIAYLSVFYPFRGGISQFNAAVYRQLEKNHKVAAFTFTRQYPGLLFPGKTQIVSDSDNADKIPARRMLDSINPLTWIRTAVSIKNFKPDLLLIQNWMPFFGPSFGFVARKIRKLNIPIISIIANMKPHEPKPGDIALSKYFLNSCDAFVVMAEAVKNDLLELKPDAHYFLHPHPNYNHFGEQLTKSHAKNNLGIPENKKIILFFGLIRKYKGLDNLIKAMESFSEDYFLLIAGEVYGDSSEYDELLKKYLPEDNYKFINRYVDDSEVADLFSAADVCCLPYRTATQSGILGIAYSFGLPVISTDVGGLKEVIEPYGAGIVCEKSDPKLIENAIREFFSGKNQVKMSHAASEFNKKYSWQSYAEGILNLYGEIK